MPSEADLLLSEGFEDAGILLGDRRRGRSALPPPGRRERRGRRPSRRPVFKLALLALGLHALPVLAVACLGRLELLGTSSEGGSGWSRSCRVVWEGAGDPTPGPAVPPDSPAAVPDAMAIASEIPTAAPSPARLTAPRRGGGGSGGPVRGEGESLGSAGELDAPIWNPRPAYPSSARKAGWEGCVEIALEVAPDGRVIRARVLSSSGHGILDRAALAALGRWRFAPRRPGASMKTFHQEVVFRLEDATAVSLVQK